MPGSAAHPAFGAPSRSCPDKDRSERPTRGSLRRALLPNPSRGAGTAHTVIDMVSHFGCVWRHDEATDPVYMWTELDDDRWEIRKVEHFRDGTRLRADPQHPDGETGLGLMPVPPLDAIDAQLEFTVEPLTADGFEAVWRTASYTR